MKNSKYSKSVPKRRSSNRNMYRLAEKKVAVVGTSNTTINSAGTILELTNGIVQGANLYERTGDKLSIVNHKFNFRFIIGGAASQTARVIIFRDNFNTGTAVTVADLLTANNYLALYDQYFVVQQKRFTILTDYLVDVSVAGPDLKSKQTVLGPSTKVFYNGTGGSSASNGPGAIFACVIGSNSSGTFDYQWEVTYTDF